MYRRFLYLVSQHCGTRIYSLHRMNIDNHLFYGCTAEAQATNKGRRGLLHKIKSSLLLPRAEIRFRGAQTAKNSGFGYWFSLLGGGDSRILFADDDRQTALYNADLQGIAPMPSTNSGKGKNPICLPMAQDDRTGSPSLYVMPLFSHTWSEFEVLARTRSDLCTSKDWCWHTLPRPPFHFDHFDPSFEENFVMWPHSVVNSRTICVSSSLDWGPGGTYSYDTVSSVWSKAGDWELPFFGKAEYVPELNLWFGLTTCKPSYRLCAFDLSAMDHKGPPMPQHTWDVFDLDDDRPPSHVHLVNLGAGRFCIATFFEPLYDDEEKDILEEEFVVLTGVEVKRKVDDEANLLMTEHMSKCFSLGTERLELVL